MSTTFKPPSKSLTPRDYLFIAGALFGVFVFGAALLYTNLNYLNPLGGGGGFYVPWMAGRAFLFEHADPYSAYVPEHVQQLVYRRAAQAGEKPYITDFPFYLLIGYIPFSLLPEPQIARAIFTLLAELALFGLAYLSLRLTNWESPPLFAVLFVVFCASNFYTFQAVLEATPALFLGFIYAGILYALHTEQDELAGALIAISCYHWEVGGPFLILILLHAWHERRSRVLAGFVMFTLTLGVVSFIVYPNWFIPFLRATVNNLRSEFGFSTQTALRHLWPEFGGLLAWALIIILLLALAYEWSVARGPNPRRLYWTACLSLAAAPLLGWRTELPDLVILVLPLALVFAITCERWRGIGGLLIYLLLLLVLLIPWALNYYVTPRLGDLTNDILFLFYPLFTVIGLYWIRWWALRPPRTWFDRARLN